MFKILFVSGSLSQNGTEMFMMNVLRGIDKNNFHIDFCIFSNEITPNRLEAESFGCKVYVLPSRREYPIKSIVENYKFIKKYAKEYDVVHWNGGNLSSIIGFVLYKHFDIPIRIVHAHSSSSVGFHNKLLHTLHREFIGFFCTHYFACSIKAAKYFYKSKPFFIIRNGIDVVKFDYNNQIRNDVREEFEIPVDAQVFGHVGRFDDNKNHSFLLDIFANYCVNNKDAFLLLVGHGETFDDVVRKISDLGLSHKVILTGIRNDVNRLLQAMDCFVMPSKFEGMPFVLIEAQCSGLPCFVSDSIDNDVDITGNVKFLPISNGAQFWSKIICDDLMRFVRKSQIKIVEDKGFSLKSTVEYLEKIYSNII